MVQAISITCPGCGEPLSFDMKKCPCCRGPVVISTFNSVYSMTPLEVNKYASTYKKALADHPNDTNLNLSMAMCYLKLKLYDKALPCFEKAIEDNFDNSEAYFYAAVCLLAGKKPFVLSRPIINKILEYVGAALMIEPRGIFYYFMAYIKQDYFARKFFTITPSYQDELANARQAGVSDYDIDLLFQILGTPKPTAF